MPDPFKPKILVVEDDAAMLRLLGELLKEMGAEAHLFASSPGAAEFVDTHKLDGAIVDWRMPEMDGLELARRIRHSKSNNKIPIVMLTGVTGAKATEESFGVGINFFLQKPVSVAQLRALLNASRGAMLQERRRYQRAPVFLRARCFWQQRQTSGDIVNLSASGLKAALYASRFPARDAVWESAALFEPSVLPVLRTITGFFGATSLAVSKNSLPFEIVSARMHMTPDSGSRPR